MGITHMDTYQLEFRKAKEDKDLRELAERVANMLKEIGGHTMAIRDALDELLDEHLN